MNGNVSIHHRACPLCEAICGLQLKYADGVLTSIRGDDADAFSRGHLCPKGVAILDLENDPDRVRGPMRQVEGEWRAATWDEAFAESGCMRSRSRMGAMRWRCISAIRTCIIFR